MKKVISHLFSTDHDIEQLIGKLLRLGVTISCVIAVIGGIFYLIQHGAEQPHYETFSGEPAAYTSLPGILNGLRYFSATEIIQFGVLVLISTPILRIAFSLVAFIFEKDKLYVLITTIVLGIILFSMLNDLAG